MTVLIIGDSSAGKTLLVKSLAEAGQAICVRTHDMTYQSNPGRTDGNNTVPDRFKVTVTLPSNPVTLPVKLVDTGGELWAEDGPDKFPQAWEEITQESKTSEGIILVLQPYYDLWLPNIQKDPQAQEANALTRNAGNARTVSIRFKRWMDFFNQHCTQTKRLLICLNKVDLVYSPDELKTITNQLRYNPGAIGGMGWQDRHNFAIEGAFWPIQNQINTLSQQWIQQKGGSVQCFLTTKNCRPLLELPWIYLATCLSAN
jgi:hypothetical protein